MQLTYSEPALLEATLALIALYPGVPGSGSHRDAVVHQAKAIRAVNSRLDNPATAVTDGVLAAVFMLAYYEVSELFDFCKKTPLKKQSDSCVGTSVWQKGRPRTVFI